MSNTKQNNKALLVKKHKIKILMNRLEEATGKKVIFEEYPKKPGKIYNEPEEYNYGTEHLEQQDAELGTVLTSLSQLRPGVEYCIVDFGLDEWNSGYKFKGTSKSADQTRIDYHFKDVLDGPSSGGFEKPVIFSKGEMDEFIELKAIAFEGFNQ